MACKPSKKGQRHVCLQIHVYLQIEIHNSYNSNVPANKILFTKYNFLKYLLNILVLMHIYVYPWYFFINHQYLQAYMPNFFSLQAPMPF